MSMTLLLVSSLASALLPSADPPPLTFSVSFPAALRAEPASGRLVVYLIRSGSTLPPGEPPSNGPFWSDLQPMFGADVSIAPGDEAVIDERAAASPAPLADLAPGDYTAQAVLDVGSSSSNWRLEEGNLYSEVVKFSIAPDEGPRRVKIELSAACADREFPNARAAGIELFEVRSEMLSKFHGRDVMLRAGVVPPINPDPSRRYAAVYEVPGFGGDHAGAYRVAMDRRRAVKGSSDEALARNCYWIVLDPESGNGHTLFADSANNGPCGEALVRELIPALEERYRLAPSPEARLLRGHSSGGWSVLWLAITYPEVFGACWASSPDPVDFRAFQLADIYRQSNMYAAEPSGRGAGAFGEASADVPSVREDGVPIMSIRQENGTEEVMGADNTSGQQWDSWMAVFGPRNDRGHPAALFDPVTGAIDHAIAEQYRKYDIADRLRADPGTIGPIFHQRIRLVVGDQDDFYLNEAVALLKPEVEGLSFLHLPEGRHGSITIVPGRDHGSIFESAEVEGFPADMLNHLRRNALAPSPLPPPPK